MTIKSNWSPHKNSRIFIYLIISIVFLCFYKVLGHQFVWDDRVNFVENPHFRGLDLSNLKWMFTTWIDANFHPILWVTFGIDYILWEMNPAGYHLTNLVIHALNTVLVFFLILSFIWPQKPYEPFQPPFEIKAAAFVGALFFGIHPLRVEPVSWLSARGDLLCCFFYLPAIMAYLEMVKNEETASIKKKWLIITLSFFIFSLLSRALVVTLPVVLLILDIYPLSRFQWQKPVLQSNKKILYEKIPFLILSLATGVLALSAKRESMASIMDHNLLHRFMQAIVSVMHYPWKTLVPISLSPLYLLDLITFTPFEIKNIGCLVLFIGIFAILIAWRKRHKWLLTAFSIYLATVSPMLGFFQAGPQLVADRYSYISCLPFAILAAAGMLKLFNFIKDQQPRFVFHIFVLAWLGVGLIFLSILSFKQLPVWSNDTALWNHVLRLDPKNYYAHYCRGVELGKINDVYGALNDYDNAIKFNPKFPKPYNNRGVIRIGRNDLEGAYADLSKALELDPTYSEAHANLGVLLYKKSDYISAAKHFNKALELSSSGWRYRENVLYFLDKMKGSKKSGK